MSDSKPRVTIGMPVYNGENYLAEAIESALAQTFTDLEVLIADNASEDGTQAICEAYARRDPRVRYHRQARNLGAGPNQNWLVANARGDFFIWLMHDDIYEAPLVEACMGVLDSRPDVVTAFASMMKIDPDGRPIGPQREDSHLVDERPYKRLDKCVMQAMWVIGLQGVIRMDALRRSFLVKPYRGSDRALLAELALMGKVWQLAEPYNCRRIHELSSLEANADPESINAWYDTNYRGGMKNYLVTLYLEYHRAVLRHPELGRLEQLRCLWAIQRWPWQGFRNWAGLRRRELQGWLLRKAGLAHPKGDGTA